MMCESFTCLCFPADRIALVVTVFETGLPGKPIIVPIKLVGWLCLTSHRPRGHLETAPPFTVPCEGREAR